MKLNLKLISLSLLVSTSALAGPYELRKFPIAEIDRHLIVGSDESHTPKALQGLWWMDGNPVPDEVMSFASAKWQDILEDGVVVGHSATIAVYDEGVWSWHNSIAGRYMYQGALNMGLVYNLEFNADYSYGNVTPGVTAFKKIIDLKSDRFASFTMTQVEDGEYRRDTVINGKPSTYRLRRIVDGDSNRLPIYESFAKEAGVENLLLPYCKEDTNTSLPTSCIKD